MTQLVTGILGAGTVSAGILICSKIKEPGIHSPDVCVSTRIRPFGLVLRQTVTSTY
jgi:hypothetical protein